MYYSRTLVYEDSFHVLLHDCVYSISTGNPVKQVVLLSIIKWQKKSPQIYYILIFILRFAFLSHFGLYTMNSFSVTVSIPVLSLKSIKKKKATALS